MFSTLLFVGVISLGKTEPATSAFSPLETATARSDHPGLARWRVLDGAGRPYAEAPATTAAPWDFTVRGSAGRHEIQALGRDAAVLESTSFTLRPATHLRTDTGPYTDIARWLENYFRSRAGHGEIINQRFYAMLVRWGRDHVYAFKAGKYFLTDAHSGLDYWLETQAPNGMFWDCIHPNITYPAPTLFGEALGEGWFWYDDGGRRIVRRIPVEADVEYLITEGVWAAWQASGDRAWLATQLPRLERALTYNTSDPLRWSPQHGLVKRSFTMDSWDFANPHFCAGDYRVIHPGDPQFFFHGDNSGLYASYGLLARMHEALGNPARARELRAAGAALRERANRALFFGRGYAHMVPETLPAEEVHALVGDERERLSLSTAYTINRGLPTHDMAVNIIDEYRRRRDLRAADSFAEWWSMDPPYRGNQWKPVPNSGNRNEGEYMNGAICTIVAGELAKAASDHGREDYAFDIYRRLGDLFTREGGRIPHFYRRLPADPKLPAASFQFVDLRPVVNRGLRHDATPGVPAWIDDGDNDMRNLPTGEQTFGPIRFQVIDPATNAGRAVLHLPAVAGTTPPAVEIAVPGLTGRSLYFLHSLANAAPYLGVIGTYEILYRDGTRETIHLRYGKELGHWREASDLPDARRQQDPVDRTLARVAWRGPNPDWKNVGLYMFGWNNPHPAVPIDRIIVRATWPGALPPGAFTGLAPGGQRPATPGGLLLAGISVSDQPRGFEVERFTEGLPEIWANGAIFHGLWSGLGGLEDTGVAFDRALIAPRWAASEVTTADVSLHYPSSNGYCTYRFTHDRSARTVTLDITGSPGALQIRCLLPPGMHALAATSGGQPLAVTTAQIETSAYAEIPLDQPLTAPLVITYAPAPASPTSP